LQVIIKGPAHVRASSLRVMEPGIKYSLDIILSFRSMYGRAVITVAENICTDQAGNHFTRTNGSTIIIHFGETSDTLFLQQCYLVKCHFWLFNYFNLMAALDRRPVQLDLWTSVPSYELVINGVPRTVLATNKLEDIKLFLDFSIPIINSTKQILKTLHVNSGNLIPIHGKLRANRRFVFEVSSKFLVRYHWYLIKNNQLQCVKCVT
jgi:hypothetical protein